MKAISIKQPWASLIAHGIKDVENRTWKTNYRGKIYIHASGKSAGEFDQLLTNEQYDSLPFYSFLSENYIKSSIIGEVDIVNCDINYDSVWADKTETFICPDSGLEMIQRGTPIIYNWVLENPVIYEEPIFNVKGKLSLWEYNAEEEM